MFKIDELKTYRGFWRKSRLDEVEGKCGNLTKEIAVTSVSCHLFAEINKQRKKENQRKLNCECQCKSCTKEHCLPERNKRKGKLTCPRGNWETENNRMELPARFAIFATQGTY